MPIKYSIRVKIFGLAVLLLSFTIVLAGFLLIQVIQTQRTLQVIAEKELPLATALSSLNETGLRRRLAFERWFGALNQDSPNRAVIAEASTNYVIYSQRISTDIARAHALLAKTSPHDLDQLDEIRFLLAQVEEDYPRITARQQEVLALQREGARERAHDILNVLNELQSSLQNHREKLQEKMATFAHAAAESGVRGQNRVVWLTALATLLLVVLGIVVAAMITRRLVAPVHSLLAGLRTVETGDLNVELPIRSTDEVALLTRSFNYFIRELRDKEQIKRTFGRYMDPRILERVILQPGTVDTAGGRRVMTVSFADLAGFTELSEQLTPSGLVNLLNRYFTLQSNAIQQHLGVVDKFIGDAVMAFWGPPFTTEGEHALLACRSALSQWRAVQQFLAELPELTGMRKNLPRISFRLGINTGDLIVGNLGSENARSYTVIGDTVNTASRLEGANKFYGTHLLISEATRNQAGTGIVTREVDLLGMKGKDEPTRVFELLALREEVSPEIEQLCQRYAEALAAYRSASWAAAEQGFQECLRLFPQDGPAKTMLARVVAWRAAPPAPGWDGVWRLDSK